MHNGSEAILYYLPFAKSSKNGLLVALAFIGNHWKCNLYCIKLIDVDKRNLSKDIILVFGEEFSISNSLRKNKDFHGEIQQAIMLSVNEEHLLPKEQEYIQILTSKCLVILK